VDSAISYSHLIKNDDYSFIEFSRGMDAYNDGLSYLRCLGEVS